VASAKTAPQAIPLVRLQSLSSRPKPPSLDDLLRQNYPADARRQGIGGSAVVSARIDPDGVVRAVRVVLEEQSGFGEACRRTLLGSRWSPPTDSAGRAVFTEIRYTCRFQVIP
jgi:TonB family protein